MVLGIGERRHRGRWEHFLVWVVVTLVSSVCENSSADTCVHRIELRTSIKIIKTKTKKGTLLQQLFVTQFFSQKQPLLHQANLETGYSEIVTDVQEHAFLCILYFLSYFYFLRISFDKLSPVSS